MMVPAGKHTIEFRFEPASFYVGSNISLITYSIMILLLIGGIVIAIMKSRVRAAE